MKRVFTLSALFLCVGLVASAFHPTPVQGKSIIQANVSANGQTEPVMGDDTPENHSPSASILLQDQGPIADGHYTTVDYTFTAQAGETVVVYWEALGSKVELHDLTSQAIAPMPYALPNLDLRELSNHHVAFRLLTTGEHRLSFIINGYDNRSAQSQDPRYFIRVRPASEVERLMAEATTLSAEYRDTSVRSLIEAAWPLVNRVIEQSPPNLQTYPQPYPQPYILRVRLAAQLAISRGEFEGYSGQDWQRELYDVFRAQPLETQALIMADLKTAISNYEALAAFEEGAFAAPVDLDAWHQLVILLETGIPSAYLEDDFFNTILPTLIF